MPLAIIVHGGAGAIAPARRNIARTGCLLAASIGWRILIEGGSALEAITAAIIVLENNPNFNAGTGSCLTTEGIVEMDAGIMRGDTLDVGAVAGIHNLRNPILAAREVLTSPQVLLIGEGAERFAASRGIPFCDSHELITLRQRERWNVLHGDVPSSDLSDPAVTHGTVGAVALDSNGNIVAAASTGGIMNKPAGRVGDTPIPGAGFYAENGIGGVSCTGKGEDFLRLTLARRTIERITEGTEAQAAAEASITELEQRVHGSGGLIAIDAAGHVGWARNTDAMSYAYMSTGMEEPISGA
jgi:L-asparaginase / beta-aspartyl-peptidase